MYLKYFLVLFLSFFAWSDMTVPPKSNEHQFFNSKNLLKNPGAENGKDGNWTASAGTYTVTSTAADVGEGARALSWDAAASADTLTSNSYTITTENGYDSQSGVASVLAKCDTGTCTHSLQVYDGTNIIATTTITFVGTTTWSRTSLNFVFPTSGTVALRIYSNANEPLAFFDSLFLGKAQGYNIANISQATHYGTAFHAATTNCTWSSTATSFTAVSADTDCPAPTLTGNVTAPATKVPGFVVSAVGKYIVLMSGARCETDNANGNTTIKISDGTISSNGVQFPLYVGDGAAQQCVGTFYFEKTTAGASTFNIYVDTSAGTFYIRGDDTGLGGSGLRFEILKFPSNEETLYKPDELNWLVSAAISGTSGAYFDLGTSDISSVTGMTDADMTMTNDTVATITAQIPCASTNESNSTTCNSYPANESNGISFVLPRAGKIEVCTTFFHGADAGDAAATGYIEAGFKIVETGNADQTPSQTGSEQAMSFQQVVNGVGRRIVGNSMHLCSIFNMTSSGKKTFRLFVEQEVTATVGSSQVYCINNTNNNDGNCHWTVRPIDVVSPPVVISNMLTTPNISSVKIGIANLQCDDTSSEVSDPESMVSTVGNISSGTCAITLTTGFFTATPICTATTIGTGNAGLVNALTLTSATSVSMKAVVSSTLANITGADDYMFSLMCMGQ